jgi:hypothetical protein
VISGKPHAIAVLVALLGAADAAADSTIYTISGASPASIQATVDAFRAALGPNNGVGGSFETGRREINWDGVPDAFASPNDLPADFFNATSPRGLELVALPGGTGFRVSADNSNPTATPVEFADLDLSFAAIFGFFSAQRLFTSICSTAFEVEFRLPGTDTPATVAGFGAVFTDVDAVGATRLTYYDASDAELVEVVVPVALGDETLSFAAVHYDGEAPIARVRIQSGDEPLGFCNGGFGDRVAMDDFLYGEPVPEPAASLTGVAALAAVAALRTARSG